MDRLCDKGQALAYDSLPPAEKAKYAALEDCFRKLSPGAPVILTGLFAAKLRTSLSRPNGLPKWAIYHTYSQYCSLQKFLVFANRITIKRVKNKQFLYYASRGVQKMVHGPSGSPCSAL